jgi:uroporphyrinogen-III synthase
MTDKYILITRPQHDAETIAHSLQEMGLSPFIEPMLSIVPLDVQLPDLNAYDGLIFTSANGVRTVSDLTAIRDIPVYAVGPHTKEAALSLGWNCVTSVRGSSKELAVLLEKEGRAWQKALHLSGEHIATELKIDGLDTDRVPVYRAEKATALSKECLQLLDERSLAAVIFFSKRTAETFVDLIKKYERTDALSATKALCIADSVVVSLKDISWQDVQVARTPDRNGVLALIGPRNSKRE